MNNESNDFLFFNGLSDNENQRAIKQLYEDFHNNDIAKIKATRLFSKFSDNELLEFIEGKNLLTRDEFIAYFEELSDILHSFFSNCNKQLESSYRRIDQQQSPISS